MSNTNVSFTLTASDKTQAAFASVGNGLGLLKSKSESLFSAFSGGIAGGLATGLLGAGFTAAITGAIDSLDKLNDASERLGISVEDLSALNFAGKMNGVEFDDMTAALAKLSSKMQDAAAGGKESGALFADMGIKVTDASGKLKSADAVFAEMADQFSKFEDGAGKTALAVDAFGKSGAKLVPVLNGGAAGLKAMREEAASLGGIIDGKLAKQAADFNDNMDKLSVLSGSVAKSITGELLPSLNKLAAEFLAAKSAGMGFFDTLYARSSSHGESPGEKIRNATAELEKLSKARSDAYASNKQDGGSIDTSGMDSKIASLTTQIAYYKKLQLAEALDGADGNYGNEGRGRSSGGGKQAITRTPTGEAKGKGKAAAKEIAEATAEATAYGKAMESLAKLTGDADSAQLDLTKSQKTLYDLMTSAEWANMPDSWKQTAVAQFETARAAEEAADSTKRLNDMLADTESAGIEKARSDMLLLVEALEKGIITEQQYVQAASARLKLNDNDKAKDSIKDLEEFTNSAARNMQSSLADFIFDPFANGIDGMAARFGQMLQRMAAEAAAAAIMKNLFGNMGQGSSSGGGSGAGSWGAIGSLIGMVGGFFGGGAASSNIDWTNYTAPSWDGGGYTGDGSRSGGVDGKGGFPAILHPNETVIDHAKGQRMSSGGSNRPIVIHVNSSTGDKAEIRRSAATGARAALGAIGGAQRYA